MTHGRLITLAALAALAISACSKNSEPTASPVSAATDTATPTTTASPQVSEGSPQLATEPDGLHIEYRVYGKGDPAIVLIHGWATDANYWNAQINPLKAKYTVVAVDLAGHGASAKGRTDWSMDNYGEDVATVVRKLPNQQVILVGHSMGGTVALEASRRIGDRVIGIIVVDAPQIGWPAATAPSRDRQARRTLPHRLYRFGAQVRIRGAV